MYTFFFSHKPADYCLPNTWGGGTHFLLKRWGNLVMLRRGLLFAHFLFQINSILVRLRSYFLRPVSLLLCLPPQTVSEQGLCHQDLTLKLVTGEGLCAEERNKQLGPPRWLKKSRPSLPFSSCSYVTWEKDSRGPNYTRTVSNFWRKIFFKALD